MKPDPLAALNEWRQRCKAQGLALTASRNAILRALSEQSEARDAVPLLTAAQRYHPSTSIGTVYRFMRELEQRGVVNAYIQPHGRTRWQLRDVVLPNAAHAANDLRRMLVHVQDFLHTLEHMGLADATSSDLYTKEPSPSRDRVLAALHEVAGQLGYRLLPDPRFTT